MVSRRSHKCDAVHISGANLHRVVLSKHLYNPRLMKISRSIFRRLAALTAALLLVACQPSPAERLQRAEALVDEGDYKAAIIELKNVLRDDDQNNSARKLLAKSAYQTADFPTAEIEYERFLGSVGDDAEAWLGLGRTLLNQRRSEEAFERVVPALRDRRDNLEAQVFVADVLATLGNADEAEEHYKAALALDENAVQALVGMAVVSAMRNDEAAALDYLEQARSRNPNSDVAWRATGNFARMNRQLPAAADAYAKAIANETPQTPEADRFATRMNRASVLLDSLQFDDARAQIQDMGRLFGGHPLMFFLRGRLAFGEGDYEVAQRELRDYLARAPNDLRGQAIMGAINFSQNYLRQAEMFLQQAAREGVGGDVTRRLLAETQLRLHKPEAAIQSLGALDEDYLSDPMTLSILGRAELGRGNSEAAIRYLEQGVASNPDDPSAQLSLAAGLMAAESFDEAIAVLERMPPYSVDDYRRESLLMAALLKKDDTSGAIAAGKQLVADNLDDSQAHVVAGMLRYSLGDMDEARNYFRNALVRDSKKVAALYGLGRVAEQTGDTATAKDWYAKAVDADPSFGSGLAALARIATSEKNYASVAGKLADATEASPELEFLWVLRARTAYMNDANEEVMSIIDAAREFHPDDPLLSHIEGLALIETGQQEAGLRRLTLAADAAPDNARLQLDLAKAQLENRNYRGALLAIERYREILPSDRQGLAVQLEVLARDGKLVAAKQRLNDFRRNNGDDPQLSVMAGDIEMIAGDAHAAAEHYEVAAGQVWGRALAAKMARAYQGFAPQKSIATLERWVAENPDDYVMRRMLAQYLDGLGQGAAAESEYEKVLAENGDDPVALNNLAWRYAQSDSKQALVLARRASELAPDNGSISDTLGWILYLDGQLDQALRTLQRAEQQSPQNLEIKYHLAKVMGELGRTADAKALLGRTLAEGREFPSRAEAQALAESL